MSSATWLHVLRRGFSVRFLIFHLRSIDSFIFSFASFANGTTYLSKFCFSLNHSTLNGEMNLSSHGDMVKNEDDVLETRSDEVLLDGSLQSNKAKSDEFIKLKYCIFRCFK